MNHTEAYILNITNVESPEILLMQSPRSH